MSDDNYFYEGRMSDDNYSEVTVEGRLNKKNYIFFPSLARGSGEKNSEK